MAFPLPEEQLPEQTTAQRSPVAVVPVESRADWRAFHRLPYAIYKDDPNWIAPLLLERKFHFEPAHNPFFQHAKAAFWLALRDGKPVGRITAQIDDLHLERHKDATGHFGFIEATDDPKVFAALLDTAEAWLKSQGMRRVLGPVSFSMWDEPGLLVEGFDTPPVLLMGHHLPYYQTHIAAHGYGKIQDLLAYDYEVMRPLPPAMAEIIARTEKKHPITYRNLRMDKAHFKDEVALLLDIVNDAWADNWGYVPLTKAELDDMASMFKILLKPDHVAIAEYAGEPAAFALGLPNLNAMIRDLKGRLFPFGIVKLLWRLKMKAITSARLPLMGVRKKWQNSHIGAALAMAAINQMRSTAMRYGVPRAELSWILESNERLRHMLTLVGGRVYKRYRIFEKAL